MTEKQENIKKSAKEHSDKLATLGMKLNEIQFSYKIEGKSTKEYWQKRIDDFKKYSESGMEYYNQVYSLMNLVNKEESQTFLFHISKFRQLGITLLEIMEKIKENPSIADTKDKQQSYWSKEIKNQALPNTATNVYIMKWICKNSQHIISLENSYEKYLKKILE